MVYTKVSTYIDPEDVLTDLGFPRSKNYPLQANAAAAQAVVEVGVNSAQHFPIGAKILIATRDATIVDKPNAEYYVLEYGTVLSVAGANVTLSANLTGTYNTADNSTIQLLSKYTEATNPRYQDLDVLVRNIEDQIDAWTHTSWGQKVVVNEYHNFQSDSRRFGTPRGVYARQWNIRDTDQLIQLNNQHNFTFDDTLDTAYTGYPGDSMQIWDGEQYTEVVNALNPYGAAAYVAWTNQRDGDYWQVPELGLVIFGNERPAFTFRACKFIYRYGQTVRAASDASGFGDIQLAVRSLAKAAILRDRRFLVDWPGGAGADALGIQQSISAHRQEAERLMARHRELKWNTDRH